MTRRLKMSVLHALPVLAFLACAADPVEAPPEMVKPTLADIELKIFARSCAFSSCHGATGSAEGLSLVSPVGDLRDRMSKKSPGRVLVKAGDPDGSYLIEKLTKEKPEAGKRMPDANDALPAATINAIREWIRMGAMLN